MATTVFTLAVQAIRRGIEVGWEVDVTTDWLESSCAGQKKKKIRSLQYVCRYTKIKDALTYAHAVLTMQIMRFAVYKIKSILTNITSQY